MTSHTALCECKYSDILSNNIMNNDITGESLNKIIEIVDESNIEVLKCLFKALEKFSKDVGGFIIIGFTISSAISTIFFFIIEYTKLKSHILRIYDKFKSLISKKTLISNVMPFPPKRKKQKNKTIEHKNSKKGLLRKNKKKKSQNYISNTSTDVERLSSKNQRFSIIEDTDHE